MIHLRTAANHESEPHKDQELMLVVDGDRAFRRFAVAALHKRGRPCVGMCSGEEALAWLAAHRAPALLVLDTVLPGIDGVRLCREVRAHPRAAHVPILACSTATSVDEHLRALDAGADVFLAKPVRPALFLDTALRLATAPERAWIESEERVF